MRDKKTILFLLSVLLVVFSLFSFQARKTAGEIRKKVLAASSPSRPQDQKTGRYQEFKKGELLVKFRQSAGNAIDETLKKKINLGDNRQISKTQLANLSLSENDLPEVLQKLKRASNEFSIKKIEPVLRNEKLAQLAGNKIQDRGINLLNLYKVTFNEDSADVLFITDLYKKDPNVELVEPNYLFKTFFTPVDQYYPIQYPLNNTGQEYPVPGGTTTHGAVDADIDASEAWDFNKGGGVTVAVIDTGVDSQHSDMVGQMWVNIDEIPANGIDDDNNGYIDDVNGYDFVNNDGDPSDDMGHGTHCAGIIAAKQDNVGVSGIAPESKIMALKFLGSDGSGSEEDAIRAINYAVANGANIMSNSWGGSEDSQLLEEAFNSAFVHGVAAVVAAGNDATDIADYPAGYENVIAVAATDSNDRKASFSNFGNWVEISSPGKDILSLRAAGTDMYGDGRHIYANNYYLSSGTSMATPHAAGVLALIMSQFPGQDIHSLYGRLLSTADNLDGKNPDFAGLLGAGRVNAHQALTGTPSPIFRFQNYHLSPLAIEAGKQYSLTVNLKNIGTTANNVSARLETTDSFISPGSSTVTIGTVGSFSVAGPTFNFTTSGSCPMFHEINFKLTVNYDSTQTKEFNFLLKQQTPFEPGWPIPISVSGEGAPTLADINHDGKEEIILGSEYNRIYVLDNQANILPGWPFVITNNFWSNFTFAVGDVDGNGEKEIVAAMDLGSKGRIYVLNKDGTLAPGWPFEISGYIGSTPALADLDGDGKSEIIFGGRNGKAYVLNHDGTLVSGWPVQVGEWVVSSPSVGDIDKDGGLEIVIGSRTSQGGYVYILNPDGTSVPGWPLQTDDWIDSSPALADINNDGDLEIVFGSWNGKVYAYNRNGTLVPGWPYDVGLGNWITSSPAIGDINKDGQLEIIFGGAYSGKIYALKPDGTLVPGWPVQTDWYTSISPALGDIDNDGKLEVITASADNKVYALNDDGTSVPGWPVDIGEHTGSSPSVGDTDKDGRVEVYIGRFALEYPIPQSTPGIIYWPKFRFDNYNTGLYKSLACSDGDKGNLNCDSQGLINTFDLSILLASWAPFGPVPTSVPSQGTADIAPPGGDGRVDSNDLSTLLSHWKPL